MQIHQVIAGLQRTKLALSEDQIAFGQALDECDNEETHVPVSEAMTAYLGDLTKKVMKQSGVDEAKAREFISGVADKLAESGEMESPPDDADDDVGAAVWLESATEVDFSAKVLELAKP